VEPGREQDLVAGFDRLVHGGVPDGLLRTELLRGGGNSWRIETLWRDRAALDAMRSSGQPPAAPQLFASVGAEPVLAIFDLEARYAAATDGHGAN
jgi:hypothetical protein